MANHPADAHDRGSSDPRNLGAQPRAAAAAGAAARAVAPAYQRAIIGQMVSTTLSGFKDTLQPISILEVPEHVDWYRYSANAHSVSVADTAPRLGSVRR